MSLCDRQAIPESLLRAQEVTRSGEEDRFGKDIETLEGFSFISISEDGSTFDMHRLVQLSTRKWLETRGERDKHIKEFIAKLDLAFPTPDHENWSQCQTLFPHAMSAFNLTREDQSGITQWASVIQRAAEYASALGGARLWTQAIEMGERCWKTRKEKLGEEHPNTLTSMSHLAQYYDRLGDSRKAAEMGEQCRETRKKQLGEEHPDTLTSISNLAWYCDRLGNCRKAAEMGEQCLETRKQQLGEEHPDTLMSMSNLAW